MTTPHDPLTGEIIPYEEQEAMTVVETTAVSINRSEVESQITAAHRFPRSIKRFLSEATTMATLDEETAQSCIYALPRGGKTVSGPSVRLAEICASAWGNLQVAARPYEVGETTVTAQGVCWDMQANLMVKVETKRKITDKGGKRFNEDMILMTENAASSIALRNAILRVIPRAYINKVYDRARQVAVGDAKTLATRRSDALAKLAKLGADQVRVLAALGRAGVDDITLDDLETLFGYHTAVKEGTKSVDEVFPAPVAPTEPAAEGRRMSLKPAEKKLKIEVPPPVLAPESLISSPPEPGSEG